MKYLPLIIVLISSLTFGAGFIQNESVKSYAEIKQANGLITGNLSSSSPCIASPSSLNGIAAGQFVYDYTTPARITVGTTVVGIGVAPCSAGQIKMSANANSTVSGDTISFGGDLSKLLNDDKFYVSALSINKTLKDAIISGDIGGSASVTCNGTTIIDGSYTVCKYTSSGNFVVNSGSITAEVLAVGGGGAGGGGIGGGGGAGQVLHVSSVAIGVGTYSVVVGNGGASVAAGNTGNNGSSSTFLSYTAVGGGGGTGNTPGGPTSFNGGTVASGGGAAGSNTGTATSGQTGTAFNGGAGVTGVTFFPAGGGAGASANGANGSGINGGDGGAGIAYSITGSSVTYGGGGGGGGNAVVGGVPGNGGAGGGGAGSASGSPGVAGTANTGGGGGGGADGNGNGNSGAGGSGVVIVRYQLTGTSNGFRYVGSMNLSTGLAGGYWNNTAFTNLTLNDIPFLGTMTYTPITVAPGFTIAAPTSTTPGMSLTGPAGKYMFLFMGSLKLSSTVPCAGQFILCDNSTCADDKVELLTNIASSTLGTNISFSQITFASPLVADQIRIKGIVQNSSCVGISVSSQYTGTLGFTFHVFYQQ